MSETECENSSPATKVERASLHWTVHPAAAEPARAAVVGAVILVACLLALQISGSPTLTAFAFLLLAVSLRAYFLPRRYELDSTGASEDGPLCARRRIAWSDVRRVACVRFGVHLSPLHSTSRLVPDRGLFLRTTGNRDEVNRFVERARQTS